MGAELLLRHRGRPGLADFARLLDGLREFEVGADNLLAAARDRCAPEAVAAFYRRRVELEDDAPNHEIAAIRGVSVNRAAGWVCRLASAASCGAVELISEDDRPTTVKSNAGTVELHEGLANIAADLYPGTRQAARGSA